MAITKVIADIPPAPKRSDPANFDERADAFLGRIETLDDDLNEWATQCNQTQQEINQARDDAYNYKEQAYKWAQENEDTQVDDSVHTGYSAYHWAQKAYGWASTAEDVEFTDGVHTGYSAYHWSKKAEEQAEKATQSATEAFKWANEQEDVLLSFGDKQGYSAYHWAQKVSKGQLFVATSNTSISLQTDRASLTLNEPDRAFGVGSRVRISLATDPVNTYLSGVVAAYDRQNNQLTVDVSEYNGSGSYNNWIITLEPHTLTTFNQVNSNALLYSYTWNQDITVPSGMCLQVTLPPEKEITIPDGISLVVSDGGDVLIFSL